MSWLKWYPASGSPFARGSILCKESNQIPPIEAKKVNRNIPVAPYALVCAFATSSIPARKNGCVVIRTPTNSCITYEGFMDKRKGCEKMRMSKLE
jgi:hypothetical protein